MRGRRPEKKQADNVLNNNVLLLAAPLAAPMQTNSAASTINAVAPCSAQHTARCLLKLGSRARVWPRLHGSHVISDDEAIALGEFRDCLA